MGGFGSGGRRVGAGRPRKAPALALVHGSRQRHPHERPPAHRTKAVAVPPKDLPVAVRKVWDILAPRAVAAGGLTDVEVPAFAKLCEAIAKQAEIWTRIEADGWTFEITTEGGTYHKKHPLWPDYNALERRIVAGLQHFCLEPFGKPVVAAEVDHEQQDPFEAFQQSRPALARIK